MAAGWLVRLSVLSLSEWYYSAEETPQAAAEAVKRRFGSPHDTVETVRAVTAAEASAIRIEPKHAEEFEKDTLEPIRTV